MPDSVTKDPASEVQFPPSILEDVNKLAQRVQTFTGAAGAAIALREGEEMICRASRGNNAPDVGMVLSLDGTFTGLAVTGMKAVRCDDTENDPRVDAEISRTLRIKSMAVVPVLSGVRVSGVIATFASTSNAFSDTHMAVLKTMADGLGANLQRWLESQGISTAAPARNPLRQGIAAQPKSEASATASLPPVEAARPSATPAPRMDTPTRPTIAASSSVVAAATAPAIEKSPEPKKSENRQQGKWKPVVVPKPEEAAPVAKAEPKFVPEPKSEATYAAPSFSYDAKADSSDSKKSPMLFAGIAAAVIVIAGGGYFLFGRSSSKPAASAAAPVTQSAPAPASYTPATTATTTSTPAPSTLTPAGAKTDASKLVADKTKPQSTGTQVPDVTKKIASPIVVAPTASAPKTAAEDAPPMIALAAGAGPALDIPVTTSAPRLSAPAPANAVVVPSRLLQRVNPNYPASARQYRVEGAVTLSATIGPDGRVREAKVISGPPMLRDAATGAVKQWKYAPSTVNGRAVESSVQIVLQFKMPS